MANQTAFQPMGKTVVANVSGTVNTITVTADSPCSQLRFYSISADVFVRIGSSAGNAVVSVPVPGTPGYGTPIVGGSGQILTGWQSGPFSNVTVSMSTTSNASFSLVYITPGEGIT